MRIPGDESAVVSAWQIKCMGWVHVSQELTPAMGRMDTCAGGVEPGRCWWLVHHIFTARSGAVVVPHHASTIEANSDGYRMEGLFWRRQGFD